MNKYTRTPLCYHQKSPSINRHKALSKNNLIFDPQKTISLFCCHHFFKINLGMITNNQNLKKGGTYKQLNQENDDKLL